MSKHKTKYDLVKKMNIDELTEFLYSANDKVCFETCEKSTGNMFECPIKDDVTPENCKSCIKRWLEQEV